jgi:hypothetical protein
MSEIRKKIKFWCQEHRRALPFTNTVFSHYCLLQLLEPVLCFAASASTAFCHCIYCVMETQLNTLNFHLSECS